MLFRRDEDADRIIIGSLIELKCRITALWMRLEKLSLSEVEIKMKASIVPDDGVKNKQDPCEKHGNFFQNFSRVGTLTAD